MIEVNSSLLRAEKIGLPDKESLSRMFKSKVRADGSAPPTLHDDTVTSVTDIRSTEKERKRCVPSEDDSRDFRKHDESRLFRNEQQSFLEEIQLSLVRFEVAFDCCLSIVTAHHPLSSATNLNLSLSRRKGSVRLVVSGSRDSFFGENSE